MFDIDVLSPFEISYTYMTMFHSECKAIGQRDELMTLRTQPLLAFFDNAISEHDNNYGAASSLKYQSELFS